MFKRYLLTAALAVCLIPLSFAQKVEKTGGYARILGMGNNPYIVDPFYVTVNPAWGAYYDHFLFGDLGSTAGAWAAGGVGQFASTNFRINPDFTLGFLLSRNDFPSGGIAGLDPNSIVGTVTGTNPLNNNLEVLATFMVGNTAIGFGVAYASTLNETTPPTGGSTTSKAMQLGFNAGLITKLTNSAKLDVGASLILPSASFETPNTGNVVNNEDVSETIILANARLFLDLSQKLTVVPLANFVLSSGTQERRDPADATKSASGDLASNTVLLVGVGINYKVGDFLLAGGPAFAFLKTSQDSDKFNAVERNTTVTAFPVWNLGIEWKMIDWFVARLGYVATTLKTSTEVGKTNVTETIATSFPGIAGTRNFNGATVGVGFRLGSFSLDATVNEDVLRQGLNNLGGNGPGAATFAYLSASYALP